MQKWLHWSVLSILLTGITAFLVARMRTEIHKPAITALWSGAALGGLLGWTATTNNLTRRQILLPVIAGLAAAATTAVTLQRYAVYRDWLADYYLSDSAPPFPTEPSQPSPLAVNALRRELYEERLPFPAYLQHRLAGIGDWPQPWPVVFWGGEVVLSALAAGVGATWCLRRG